MYAIQKSDWSGYQNLGQCKGGSLFGGNTVKFKASSSIHYRIEPKEGADSIVVERQLLGGRIEGRQQSSRNFFETYEKGETLMSPKLVEKLKEKPCYLSIAEAAEGLPEPNRDKSPWTLPNFAGAAQGPPELKDGSSASVSGEPERAAEY